MSGYIASLNQANSDRTVTGGYKYSVPRTSARASVSAKERTAVTGRMKMSVKVAPKSDGKGNAK